MRINEKIKKYGYRKSYKKGNCLIYDLKNKEKNDELPERIVINGSEIQFITDNIEGCTFLGTFTFRIPNELMQGISETIIGLNKK